MGRMRGTACRGLFALGLAILTAQGIDAHAAEDSRGFTFRRVTAPPTGSTRLITVQIDLVQRTAPDHGLRSDPSEEVDLIGLEPLGPVDELTDGSDVDPFWANLPQERGPGRIVQAATLPAQSPGAGVSSAGMRRVGTLYGSAVANATRGKRVSPALVLAVIMVESSGRADAVSHAGAAGLMQLMPGTAARFKVRDRFDPAESIRGGVEYLEWLLDEFKGDVVLALAGYNAGENAVRRHRGVPPYPETRAYVPKVVAAWRVASELCSTIQTSASDLCEMSRHALADGRG